MKKYIWWILAAVVVVALIFGFGRGKNTSGNDMVVTVAQGDFEVLVTVTGELLAADFVNIAGPNFRAAFPRINELRIHDLIDEGTYVNTGDYVAEIDRTAARAAIDDMIEQIEQLEQRIETMRLDSMTRLSGLRDQLLNLQINIEEAQIQVEQGIFEPQATQRSLANTLDRAERALEQNQRQYELARQQQLLNISDVELRLTRMERQYEQMLEVIAGFTIRAPQPGMVIYVRERNNTKRRTGSTINQMSNVVAQLPNLSVMLSRTFVNEIDISKLKVDQEVRIGIDAFPEKRFTGKVISVANIGEQLSGTDAKLFEVMIELNESDPVLRPAMTSSNAVVIKSIPDVTYVSIDAIYIQDSIPFVYTTRNTRQIVVLGDANDNEVIIEQGLSPGDRVFVNTPEGSANWRMTGEELIPIIAQRAEERRRERQEAERLAAESRSRPNRMRGFNPDGGQGGGGQGGAQRQTIEGMPGGQELIRQWQEGGGDMNQAREMMQQFQQQQGGGAQQRGGGGR